MKRERRDGARETDRRGERDGEIERGGRQRGGILSENKRESGVVLNNSRGQVSDKDLGGRW